MTDDGVDPQHWYVAFEGTEHGPYRASDIGTAVREHRISPASLVWKTGMPDWSPMLSRPEFAALAPPAPQRADPPAAKPHAPATKPHAPPPPIQPFVPPRTALKLGTGAALVALVIGLTAYYWPTGPWAAPRHYNAGVSLLSTQPAAAVRELDQAIALAPVKGQYYLTRGDAHVRAADSTAALDDWKRAAEMNDFGSYENDDEKELVRRTSRLHRAAVLAARRDTAAAFTELGSILSEGFTSATEDAALMHNQLCGYKDMTRAASTKITDPKVLAAIKKFPQCTTKYVR